MGMDEHLSITGLGVYRVGKDGSGLRTQATGTERLAGGHLISNTSIQNDKRVLGWLLKLAMEDFQNRGQEIELDTNEELPRLIPIVCEYFTQGEILQLVGEKAATAIQRLYRTETLQNLFLERELQKILRAFNEAGIPLMLFKGPALAHTIYPQAHLRTYHDIDALIHPADLSQANGILTGMGFTFYEEFRSNIIDTNRVGYNYILESADSLFEVLVELHTAPHPNELGTKFEIDSLWKNAQSIMILGEQTQTMSDVDHLLYLCWHYRFHSFTRLLWLYDLVVMLRFTGARFDWKTLVQTARNRCLATTLYYCLSWCHTLFGVAIPDWVFTQLRPPLACRLIIERIAMPDVAKALTSASWQPRRIIAHRSMVDSTMELLKAGVRTFFPSPASLGRRYMDRSRLPLRLFFLYYLIHPWATLIKGYRYLLKPGRRLKHNQ